MNDAKRFESMVNAYSADLYRYAYLLCRNPAMAEDLVQETFLRAWRYLSSLREERKAKSWLMTTLRRENARQYERYQPVFEDADLDQIAVETASVEDDVQIINIRQTLFRLPERYRDVLALQVIAGLSGTEIAEITKLPLATLNTRLFRDRRQLRRMLEGEGLKVANEGLKK